MVDSFIISEYNYILQKNEELHQLNLSWNGFGDDGALAISKSLETNNFIDHLNLSSNRIGYDSCIGLAKALRCNTSLKVLSVSLFYNFKNKLDASFSHHGNKLSECNQTNPMFKYNNNSLLI